MFLSLHMWIDVDASYPGYITTGTSKVELMREQLGGE